MTQAAIAAESPAAGAVEQLTLDFLAYLELERGLSRNTLAAYRCDLLQFGDYLHRHELAPVHAAHADLAAFLTELARGDDTHPPASAATLGRKVA